MTEATPPKVTLDDCPTGLFWFKGTLGFKSEYATTKHEDDRPVGLQCDAYVVAQLFSIDHGRRRDMVYVIPEHTHSHTEKETG